MNTTGKNKQIVIIGAGISGLTCLHYLKRKYPPQSGVSIRLIEKSEFPGGTVRSLRTNGCLFEAGPNGFLGPSPQTFALIEEIGLDPEVCEADSMAKIRYVSFKNKLWRLPRNPSDFLSFGLLNPIEKLLFFKDFFIPANSRPDESLSEFTRRRFGAKVSERLADPFVSGIYAGDHTKIAIGAAFPKLAAIEMEYGSILRGVMKGKKKKTAKSRMGLFSFKEGMEQVITRLSKLYSTDIAYNQSVRSIKQENLRYCVTTDKEAVEADEIVLCVPAFCAAEILAPLDKEITSVFQQIDYVPVFIAYLVYAKSDIDQMPKGFGYLIPSSENREVLGVLFESQIFPNRCPEGKVLLRVMIGGARHRQIIEKGRTELLQIAIEEIKRTLKTQAHPESAEAVFWKQAIPQYDCAYLKALDEVSEWLTKFPGLHLAANYWNGVSFNDCIENAYKTVTNI